MKLEFYKYQGTGNDFILIDNRLKTFPKDTELIKKLCDRRFGVGADGLILLENDANLDFKMVYYNSDGNESSMCGNGARCLVAFAKKLAIFETETTFTAVDGLHYAAINADKTVSLQMKNVNEIAVKDNYVFINTGSPHHVEMVENLKSYDVKAAGSAIRHSDLYGQLGSNVNFVEQINHDTFAVRTYERGVEDETLSCGTGVTAVAIAVFVTGKTTSKALNLNVEGGSLKVKFHADNNNFTSVFLVGPATFVFSGTIQI
jgi:diaminopimelate epimerase